MRVRCREVGFKSVTCDMIRSIGMFHPAVFAVSDPLACPGKLSHAEVLALARLLALRRRFVRGGNDAMALDVLLRMLRLFRRIDGRLCGLGRYLGRGIGGE